MRIGFIGLGNVGAKLAGTLLRNKVDLTIRDLDKKAAEPLLQKGAKWADSPKEMAESCDIIITCHHLLFRRLCWNQMMAFSLACVKV